MSIGASLTFLATHTCTTLVFFLALYVFSMQCKFILYTIRHTISVSLPCFRLCKVNWLSNKEL